MSPWLRGWVWLLLCLQPHGCTTVSPPRKLRYLLGSPARALGTRSVPRARGEAALPDGRPRGLGAEPPGRGTAAGGLGPASGISPGGVLGSCGRRRAPCSAWSLGEHPGTRTGHRQRLPVRAPVPPLAPPRPPPPQPRPCPPGGCRCPGAAAGRPRPAVTGDRGGAGRRRQRARCRRG